MTTPTTVRVESGLIDGQHRVLIDGLPIKARSGENPEATAMRHITELARKAPSGRVRAALHGPRGVHVVLVDRSGNTTVESINQHTESEGSAATDASPSIVTETPATTETEQPDNTATVPRPPRRLNLAKPRFQRGPAMVLIAALVVLLACGVVAWRALFDVGPGRGLAMDTAAGQRVPGAPPAEWTGAVAWSTPPLLAEGGPPRATVVGSDRVAVTTADRQVSMVRGADGATLWSTPLPEGEVHGPLAATSIGGTYVLAAHVGDRLTWWALDTGDELGSLALPAGSVVSFGGRAPVIGVSPTEVGAVVDGQFRRTTVPAGATALAAAPDGRLTVAAPQGWWHVQAGTQIGKTQPTPWPYASTTPVRLRPVSACGDVLVTVVPGSSADLATAVLYTDEPGSGDVEWRAQGPIRTGDQVTWRCSTSRSWGILSRTLLDFNTGEVRDLGPWTTTQIASDRALGQVGPQRVITGPQIPRGVLPQDEAFPDDLVRLDQGGDKVAALVRWTVDGSPRLYALTPSGAAS